MLLLVYPKLQDLNRQQSSAKKHHIGSQRQIFQAVDVDLPNICFGLFLG